MIKRNHFKLLYYSHIPLVFLAMVLAGTISAVLYQRINWQVILLVGLSTFVTYSLDNLMDWNRDKFHYESIQKAIERYHKVTYGLIGAAGAGIILLVFNSSNELRIGILLLGAAAAMNTTRFLVLKEHNKKNTERIIPFFLNRIFISLVWTTVCVFLPIWYDNRPIMPLTWHTFIYMYVLILSYAVIWKLEKSPFSLQKKVFSSRIPAALAGLTLLPMLVVVLDILRDYAPLHNLVNLAPPIACLIGLVKISSHPFNLQLKISLMTVILIVLCSFSAAIHLIVV